MKGSPERQRQVPGSFWIVASVDGIVARGLSVVMSARRGCCYIWGIERVALPGGLEGRGRLLISEGTSR